MVKAKPEKAAVKTKTQEPEKKEQKTKAAKKTKARK